LGISFSKLDRWSFEKQNRGTIDIETHTIFFSSSFDVDHVGASSGGRTPLEGYPGEI